MVRQKKRNMLISSFCCTGNRCPLLPHRSVLLSFWKKKKNQFFNFKVKKNIFVLFSFKTLCQKKKWIPCSSKLLDKETMDFFTLIIQHKTGFFSLIYNNTCMLNKQYLMSEKKKSIGIKTTKWIILITKETNLKK